MYFCTYQCLFLPKERGGQVMRVSSCRAGGNHFKYPSSRNCRFFSQCRRRLARDPIRCSHNGPTMPITLGLFGECRTKLGRARSEELLAGKLLSTSPSSNALAKTLYLKIESA